MAFTFHGKNDQDGMTMVFHPRRHRPPNPSIMKRLWGWHDDHPLPLSVNNRVRSVMHAIRTVNYRVNGFRRPSPDIRTVSRDVLETSTLAAVTPNRDAAEAWFRDIHAANETVRDKQGAWWPQPFSTHAHYGISIEEIAFRVIGYIEAFNATGTLVYRDRARSGGEYLLRKRLFADGHLELQGHTSIDFCYPAAAMALLALYDDDETRKDYLSAAIRIGEQLMCFQIAGSTNHAVLPARLFASLYRLTGERRYLLAMKRRIRRSFLQQRPQGDWYGYNGRVWYQAVILRCLIDAYTTTAFTLENSRFKDRLAAAIIAAVNWFIVFQKADGTFPLMLDGNEPGSADQMVRLEDGRFVRDPAPTGYPGHGGYEIDALVAVVQNLHCHEVIPIIHTYANALIETKRLWRLEFNTMAAGRYLGLLSLLENIPSGTRPS